VLFSNPQFVSVGDPGSTFWFMRPSGVRLHSGLGSNGLSERDVSCLLLDNRSTALLVNELAPEKKSPLRC